MKALKSLSALFFAGFVCSGPTLASTVLIDPTTNNGSFELADGVTNTTKLTDWDGSPDIDNWTEWSGESTASGDSGVEMTGNATDGDMVAFLQGGNATYNLTSYIAQEGDLFSFSWDHVLRADRDHSVWLVYDDGGAITKITASQTDSDVANGAPFTYSNSFLVTAGHPAIGKAVGLGVATAGAYPEIDNFVLSVTQIPEPGTLLLACLGASVLGATRQR